MIHAPWRLFSQADVKSGCGCSIEFTVFCFYGTHSLQISVTLLWVILETEKSLLLLDRGWFFKPVQPCCTMGQVSFSSCSSAPGLSLLDLWHYSVEKKEGSKARISLCCVPFLRTGFIGIVTLQKFSHHVDDPLCVSSHRMKKPADLLYPVKLLLQMMLCPL